MEWVASAMPWISGAIAPNVPYYWGRDALFIRKVFL
jgi:hypothetical protein